MANTVTITKINEGPRNIAVHVYIKSDGASGDLVDEVLIDPVDFGLEASHRFAIEDINYNFSGFDALIEFDTGLIDDKMIWVLGEQNSIADFCNIGGLVDRSGLDGSGKLQITTTGLAAATDQGSIIIRVRK